MVTEDVLSPNCSISIITVPKPFRGHIGVIQRNAIRSWKQLPVAREILLLGSEEGIAEMVQEVGAVHCPDLKLDSFGTPLLDDIFSKADAQATSDWLCYVNTDIILMPGFGDAVCRAIEKLGPCLIISRRWNLEVRDHLGFSEGWQEDLRSRAAHTAELFNVYGIDVFVFPKDLFKVTPPFALGRSVWDN